MRAITKRVVVEVGSGGSGVGGVVLTGHLVALLAEWWQCSCTTVEYELHWTMLVGVE